MATSTRPTRKDRREQRREEERFARLQASRRARSTRYATIGAVVALLALGLFVAWGPLAGLLGRGAAAHGTQYPNRGQDHVNLGQPHAAYNSNPPTSGPHFPDPLRWGAYDTPQPDEALIHNLEHGGIVVAYNCPDGCAALVQQLKDLVGQYRSKVVLVPRTNPEVPYRVTLTAWTWLDGFDDFDAARIQAFIAAHEDRGPENVPDM